MLDSRRNISLACALSALAGYVDGIGFLHLGGLFVSFMSGNSTRMGVSLAEGQWLSAAEAFGLIALFVIGAADMVSIFVRSTLVQISTPSAMRGRVSAVNLLFVGASNQLGEFESGITAQWFGTIPSVVFGGIGTLIVVALWAWMFPQLRQVERLTMREPVMPDRANPESELSPAT